MISALVPGSSGPGSSPGRGHCVVFLGKTLNFHTVLLSTQDYKWVPANCWEKLTNCGGVTCDGLAFTPGEVEVLLAASYYRNWDKVRPDGPLGSYADFTLPYLNSFYKSGKIRSLFGRLLFLLCVLPCCFCAVYHTLHFLNSNKPSKAQNVRETVLSIFSCQIYFTKEDISPPIYFLLNVKVWLPPNKLVNRFEGRLFNMYCCALYR